MTQGLIRVEPIKLAFTVLTNAGQDEVIKAALAMLEDAVHRQTESCQPQPTGL